VASTLTADHIVAIYPAPNSVTKEQAEVYLPYFIAACNEFGITNKNRVAGFLGQLGEESGELVYFEELWGPSEAQLGYEGRIDLGNTEPGDGYYFRGSGPIQITGRHNTTQVCNALGIPVDPDLLRQPKDGFRAAAYFWKNMGNNLHYDEPDSPWYQQWPMNLNEFADVGDQPAMTFGVNGGFTNAENRDWYYYKALEVLPDDLDLSESLEEEEVSEVARRLLASLETNSPPRDREIEAEKARARSRERFAQ
jgi:putative chitinase